LENSSTYRDYGSINATKLLPIIKSLNGYIQLFTELDSHIEVGDFVYITYSGLTSDIQYGFDIDNYYFMNNDTIDDDYNVIYDEFAQGYEVIYVNKEENSFTINRYLYTLKNNQNLPYETLLSGYYVSSIMANNISIYGGTIDSIVLKTADIRPLISEIDMVQCVMFKGEIYDVVLDDKYEAYHNSLKLQYIPGTNTYSKYLSLNNDNVGYSYFYNLTDTIIDCEIYGNTYYNCNITSNINLILDGGYFDNCEVSGYTINSGYFKDTTLDNSCIWNYGYWNNNWDNIQLPFTLTWNDGIFINGVFGTNDSNTIWKNGTFLNGDWLGLVWQGGKFLNGTLIGVDYIDGDGKHVVSTWNGGKFVNGTINPIDQLVWYDGEVNNGNIFNTTFEKVNIDNGIFDNCYIKGGTINNGIFKAVLIYDTDVNDGDFTYFSGSTTPPVIIDSSYLSNCNIYNGNFIRNFFNKCDIYNGLYKDGYFYHPCDVYNGNFTDSGFIDDKVYLNKAIIKIKNLLIYGTATIQKVIVIYFPDGHPYTTSNINVGDDIGLDIQLRGFNSPELNIDTVISSTHYVEYATSIDHNNIDFGYITIDYPGEDWFFDNTGLVYSEDHYTNQSGEYNIYNGIYNNCVFLQSSYNNINIIYGMFNFGVMDFDQHNNGIYNFTELNGVRYTTPYTIDYKIDYNLLKERKLYYDIAPWDYSNQQYDNVIKKIN
jgi:hypothetical protein